MKICCVCWKMEERIKAQVKDSDPAEVNARWNILSPAPSRLVKSVDI